MVFINWSNISVLGNNKIVIKSYIYLIIVPVLAKLLSRLKNPFVAQITGGYNLTIPLELPFNWVLFYFAAIFFTIGTVVYALFGPQIFKENKSFGEFEIKRKTVFHLKSYLNELGITDNFIQTKTKINIDEIKQKHLTDFVPSKKSNPKIDKEVILYYDYWRTQTVKNYPIQNLFWDIYQYSKYHNYTALLFSFISYVIGLALIAIIFIQSLKVVVL
jgi:hypothetical protein